MNNPSQNCGQREGVFWKNHSKIKTVPETKSPLELLDFRWCQTDWNTAIKKTEQTCHWLWSGRSPFRKHNTLTNTYCNGCSLRVKLRESLPGTEYFEICGDEDSNWSAALRSKTLHFKFRKQKQKTWQKIVEPRGWKKWRTTHCPVRQVSRKLQLPASKSHCELQNILSIWTQSQKNPNENKNQTTCHHFFRSNAKSAFLPRLSHA